MGNLSKRRRRRREERYRSKLGKDILQSFGATNVIFAYLEPINTLRLQALNRWQYRLGIGRMQTRWSYERQIHFFTYNFGQQYR